MDAQGELLLLGGLALHGAGGLAQQLQEVVVAQGLDVAVLAVAQQRPGAAQVQVELGQAEAGAQLRELADAVEALLGQLAHLALALVDQEIGVGLARGAADAAAQLVHLRQPQAVGVEHDHGVDARDVDAVLDDGGGEQDAELAGDEVHQVALDGRGRHLGVDHDDGHVRQPGGELVAEAEDVLDVVVDDEDGAVALDLVQDGRHHRLA